MNRYLRRFGRESVLVVLIVLSGLWSSTLSPYFLDPVNLLNSAQSFVLFSLMAFGLYPIIVQGEIDISLPSTLAVAGVVLAKLSVAGLPLVAGLPIVLVLAAVLGAVNGVLVAWTGLPSLAVTLGTMGAYRGIAYIIAGDEGVTGISHDYLALGSTWIGIVPVAVPLIVVAAVAFAVLMSATSFGRYSFAIGNSPSASRMAGVPVVRTRIIAYALAGVMSGLAGWVWIAQYQSARGDNADGAILFVLTAVVLGGVSIKGGSGRASGVFLAIVLLATLQTGMQLANVPGTSQTLVIGTVLVVTIGVPKAAQLVARVGRRRSLTSAAQSPPVIPSPAVSTTAAPPDARTASAPSER